MSTPETSLVYPISIIEVTVLNCIHQDVIYMSVNTTFWTEWQMFGTDLINMIKVLYIQELLTFKHNLEKYLSGWGGVHISQHDLVPLAAIDIYDIGFFCTTYTYYIYIYIYAKLCIIPQNCQCFLDVRLHIIGWINILTAISFYIFQQYVYSVSCFIHMTLFPGLCPQHMTHSPNHNPKPYF